MNEEMMTLARRAVTCKGWRWMPGMLIADHESGIRCLWQDDLYLYGSINKSGAWIRVSNGSDYYLPDLTDPATLGCILSLVREEWADPEAHLALGAAGWVLLSGESRVATVVYPFSAGRTEPEALIKALEAAL